MNKRIHLTACLLSGAFFAGLSSSAWAGGDFTFQSPPAVVVWSQTDTYRDVEAVDEVQSRFEQRVFKQISAFFGEAAKSKLTDEETLYIEVTNLDLAGDVRFRPGVTRELRILDDLTPPRITFSYKMMKGEQVLKQGDEKLSDINYLNSVIGPARDRPFAYENQLIKNWVKKTL